MAGITKQGCWLLVGEDELFLPFSDFPCFEHAPVFAVLRVEFFPPDHLYWPELDVDLSLESIRHPARFPLVAKAV